MRLTNELNLPGAIVEAVKNDPYSSGGSDYSVTTLLKPTQMVYLERKHQSELSEDVSSRIWSLVGQSIHNILERANRKGVAERRLGIVVDGKTVSGGMDLYDEAGVLTDYKVTSVWKVKGGDVKEWTQQLNCYAHILRANGHVVNGLQVIAILRDWSMREASRDAGYPKAQAVVVPIEMWTDEQAKAFIKSRIAEHEFTSVGIVENCTDEETWTKPTTYALMKPGASRATKVCATMGEAHLNHKAGLDIITRPGERVRCSYCSVSKFCPQFKAENQGVANVDFG